MWLVKEIRKKFFFLLRCKLIVTNYENKKFIYEINKSRMKLMGFMFLKDTTRGGYGL